MIRWKKIETYCLPIYRLCDLKLHEWFVERRLRLTHKISKRFFICYMNDSLKEDWDIIFLCYHGTFLYCYMNDSLKEDWDFSESGLINIRSLISSKWMKSYTDWKKKTLGTQKHSYGFVYSLFLTVYLDSFATVKLIWTRK